MLEEWVGRSHQVTRFQVLKDEQESLEQEGLCIPSRSRGFCSLRPHSCPGSSSSACLGSVGLRSGFPSRALFPPRWMVTTPGLLVLIAPLWEPQFAHL